KLSGRDAEDMIAGARVEVAPYKKHPMDFVLWKPSTQDQPGWSSPWGRGRPGWHIECSAMSKALLGADFDIHGGGSDLLFPHHENERAQSCCADPGHGFAEVWLHNGMIRVDGRKMSKSLGNFFTVHDKRAEMSGDVIRYILLNAHYRDELDWTDDRVDQARAAVTRLIRLADRFRRAGLARPEAPTPAPAVVQRLCDDLDTHGALAALHALASAALSAEGDETALRAALETAWFLGFSLAEESEGASDDDAVIDAACARLDAARAAKDYAAADAIRAALDAAGLVVQTTKAGTTAERGAGFDRTRLEDLK
ncbi:MAG: class I tRNA ligase family protein, partial [Pseudomonadota bacterium]|nr:class I tRNA ligase family protein [Pseudomonadota bacterium]